MHKVTFNTERWLLGAVAIFFAAHLLWQWDAVVAMCDMEGDIALLLLGTERAGRFEQLVGPYSRFHFAHPGPIVFYWYAIVAFLAKGIMTPAGALIVAQTILNAAACLSAARTVARDSSLAVPGALLLLGVILMFLAATGTPFLHYAWNPVAVLFPLCAFLVSAASLASGRKESALQLVVWWIVVAHHHIAAGAFASLIGIFAGLFAAFQHQWRPWRDPHGRRSIATGLFFGLMPIVVEALINPRGGNLGRLIRFFVRPFERLAWPEVIEATIQGMVPFHLDQPIEIAVGVVLIVAPWLRKLDADPFDRTLRMIGGVAFFAGILAARGIRGTPHDYLIWFLLPLGALNAWLVLQNLFKMLHLASPLVWFLVGMISLPSVYLYGRQSVHLGGTCRRIGEPAREALVRSGLDKSTVMISPIGKGAWAAAAEVILVFTRSGQPYCVPRQWSFMFGRRVACAVGEGAPPQRVIVTTKQGGERGSGKEMIARDGSVAVNLISVR